MKILFFILIYSCYNIWIQLYIKMSETKAPSSCSLTQNWSNFTNLPFNFMQENFPNQKLLTVHESLKNAKAQVLLSQYLSNCENDTKLSYDIGFWFWIKNDRVLQAKVNEEGFKLHYENGIKEIRGRKYNIYTGYQAKRNLSLGAFKIGAAYLSPTVTCDNRIKLEGIDKKNLPRAQLIFYHKSQYQKENWQFKLFGAYNLTHNVLQNNTLYLGYINQKHRLCGHLYNQKWKHIKESFNYKDPLEYFSDFKLYYIKRLNEKSKAAIQIHFKNKPNHFQGVTIAYEEKIPNQNAKWKGKFSSKMSVALAVEKALKSIGNYSIGVQVNDIGNANTINFGAEININI